METFKTLDEIKRAWRNYLKVFDRNDISQEAYEGLDDDYTDLLTKAYRLGFENGYNSKYEG